MAKEGAGVGERRRHDSFGSHAGRGRRGSSGRSVQPAPRDELQRLHRAWAWDDREGDRHQRRALALVYARPRVERGGDQRLVLDLRPQAVLGPSTRSHTTVAAAPHWTCGAAYDVVNCYEPGAFGVGQSMDMSCADEPVLPERPRGTSCTTGPTTAARSGTTSKMAPSLGPGGGCTSTHIGSLKLSVSDYVL